MALSFVSGCYITVEGDGSERRQAREPIVERVLERTGAAAETVLFNGRGPGDALAFSDAALVGNTLYLAGTLGLDPESGQAPEEVEEEVRYLLDNFRAKLELADMTMEDLVMVQVFCSDVSLYDRFNAIYVNEFEHSFPTRSFIGSGELLRGCRFEMNGIAVRN